MSIFDILDKNIITKNFSMNTYSSFKTGGTAKLVITPKCEEDIVKAVKYFHFKNEKYFVMGNASNLLIKDEGIDIPVIIVGKGMSCIEADEENSIIKAQAGAMLSKVGKIAQEHCLTGFEFASGIPGSVGGALIMNAGAYGGEMKDIVFSVRCINKKGEVVELEKDQIEFSYRKSSLSENEYIVTEASFKLEKGKKEEILFKMNELSQKRRDKQPLTYPSAGSTFKRPNGYFAGALIESTGLKGKRIGGAMVSEKHAGFIINYDNATSKDITDLIKFVQEEVYKKHLVHLEREVKIIGKDGEE